MLNSMFDDKKIFITGAGTIGCEIIRQLLEHNVHSIRVFDSDELKLHNIKQQYDDKLGPSYGQYFVKEMADRDKTITIPWRDLNRGIKVRLAEKGFTQDSDDYKYVVVAASTCCGKLVSHERHFFNVQRILNKINVLALLPHQA